jgi:bacteriocin biosynthesis cyclodehydratase domain-containing protein
VPVPPGAGTARRYLLRPSVEVIGADDDLYLLRPGDADLAIRGPDAVDRLLVARLAECGCTLHDLQRAAAGAGISVAADALKGKLDALIDAGAAVAHDGPPVELGAVDAERFARQLPYLAERGDAGRAQRRLREARVVVLGCGGLGTWSLAALASVGVGSFVLIDDDTVELSNLNRQILFGASDLGDGKAELAAAWVRRFDPEIDVRAVRMRITGPEQLEPLLTGADALVHAADTPPYELERWVNAACLAASVPWITSAQSPPILKIGPLYIPGRTACFTCHERQLARDHEMWPAVVRSRSERPVIATTLGPASGMLGTMIGLQLLELLSADEPPATAGHAHMIDMRDLTSRTAAVRRDPECQACSA